MKFLKSKKAILLLALAVAAIASVGAYAYFTATGNGNGTATVGTSSNQLYVVGTTSAPTLTPAGPTETVSFKAYNYAANHESISKIHLASVKACIGGTWTLPGTGTYAASQVAATCSGSVAPATASASGCGTIGDATDSNATTTDFYMADVVVDPSVDGDIAPNTSGQTMVTTGTLAMNNRLDTSPGLGDGNQNTCKDAHLLLLFSTT